jgi:precorrin-6Y C5,15-methyltransferase (decarboxylating)
MNIEPRWLSVIGIEEDGLAGLSNEALRLLEAADVIYGGARHLSMLDEQKGKRMPWRAPFSSNMADIAARQGQSVVILATGDPQWFGVGAMLAQYFKAEALRIIPARSSFSLAASAIGWPLNNVQTISLHGRAFSSLASHVLPHARFLALTRDGKTPAKIASYLQGCGFGQSLIIVMEHLGGDKQRIRQAKAQDFDFTDIAGLNIVAVECVAGPDAIWHARLAGLEDEAFIHDGQLTKSVVRAATLAALRPFPEAVLWDVGAGCGSISVEWMRAAQSGKAIAIELSGERCRMIDNNARKLGVPQLQVIEGSAPDMLDALARPDAIFIGGGLMRDKMFETCWQALGQGGVLVANVVTLESEARLIALQREYGGKLRRISVEHAEPIGNFSSWQQARPVVQWQVTRGRPV